MLCEKVSRDLRQKGPVSRGIGTKIRSFYRRKGQDEKSIAIVDDDD